MIANNYPKVVEFNARFGDPETQVVLPLLEGDFAKLLYSAATSNLDKNAVKIAENKYATCVVLASNGYPDTFEKGFEISGIEEAEQDGCMIFHAGTKNANGAIISSGGRVLGVTALGNSLKESVDNAYIGVNKINFQNKYFRKDIAKKAL